MLSAWIRMKYPALIAGSVASSAPIYYFNNRANLNKEIFFKIATSNFLEFNADKYIHMGYE